jgi:hypothetical protein
MDTLTFTATSYDICGEGVSCTVGQATLRGGRLVLSNESACANAPGLAGAGSYIWTLRGNRLRLIQHGYDICGRAAFFHNQTWTRQP